jgi:mono/diheme cytochrome c family protein
MGLTLTAASPAGSVTDPADAPTYNGEVGALLLQNCARCHRPNQIGPMSLLTYEDARRWARAIKAKVVSREMPPWFADPEYGHFANDISLSDQKIATIVEWVDGGAPRGEGAEPAPPHFSENGWSHPSGREPDYVYEFPIEWHVAADGESPNFNLVTPLPFDEEVQVEAVEIRPGNFAATHHITTRLINLPPGMKMGTGPAWPGGPVVDYTMIPDPDADPSQGVQSAIAGAAAQAEGASTGFGAYIPGVGADVTTPGQSRSIRGDLFDYIVWNLHYQATGKPETARPTIGVWYARGDANGNTVRRRSLGLDEYTSQDEQLVAPPPGQAGPRDPNRQVGQGLNPLLDPIPPNDGNWTVTGIGAVQNDSYIQSLFMHAHLRGKDFTYVLTRPDGEEEVLLRVPNYSFDWQYTYELAEPVYAPAGSTVKVIARYDNSRANRLNPAPHREVYWSEQSWDDMFLTSVSYTLAAEEEAARRAN